MKLVKGEQGDKETLELELNGCLINICLMTDRKDDLVSQASVPTCVEVSGHWANRKGPESWKGRDIGVPHGGERSDGGT